MLSASSLSHLLYRNYKDIGSSKFQSGLQLRSKLLSGWSGIWLAAKKGGSRIWRELSLGGCSFDLIQAGWVRDSYQPSWSFPAFRFFTFQREDAFQYGTRLAARAIATTSVGDAFLLVSTFASCRPLFSKWRGAPRDSIESNGRGFHGLLYCHVPQGRLGGYFIAITFQKLIEHSWS